MHIWEIFAHFTKIHITSSLFVVKYYQVNGNLPKKQEVVIWQIFMQTWVKT